MAAKDTEDTEVNKITPLYIKHSDIGDRDDRISTFQFCKMFEGKIDLKDIEGAQRIKGLWRIYMKNEEAKKKLFSENITVAGKKITIYDENPFLTTSSKPGKTYRAENNNIKITVQQLPLCVANQEIETMLKQMGCKLTSSLRYEFERDDEGKLTSLKKWQ